MLHGERVSFYLNVLYGLLILRRGHELEPLHDDLQRQVAAPQRLLDPGYDGVQFAQDLGQLEAWGAIERLAEALKIRGYKDNRRERFRYRLTEDAVALLEWLEARLAQTLEGRTADTRDRLADVLGHARELVRRLDAWRKDERGEETARRAYHLAWAIDDAIHEITAELLSFRAAMLGFASRPYQLAALRAILAWLERYVTVYLARIEELRHEAAERFATLGQPRYRQALAECRELLLSALAATPRELRRGGTLRPADDLASAQLPFFADGGGLVTLCAKIDDSAREVLRKMHRHLRELEQRSARLADLRARIRELAALPDDADGRLADFANDLVAAAHARFERATALPGERRAPAVPRVHRAAAATGARPSLRPKTRSPEEVRALRARRDADLRRWLEERVLAGGDAALLSTIALAAADAPRRWLDVARARHLEGGRRLAALGIDIAAAEGTARLGDDVIGMSAPDARIARRNAP